MGKKTMPFTPGQSGNPRGRPRKNKTLTDLLSKYRDAKIEKGEYKGMKAKDALIREIWRCAIFDKDMVAAKYIFDRLDGKPAENINLGNTPIIFKALQKELFDPEELEGENNAGTLDPPEDTGPGAGE
jgi:hypothetical protein